MQSKEDDQSNFIFDPSQFLTITQIKSYFSRLTRAQRLHGSQSQSNITSNITDDDQEEAEEAENEFDSMLSNIQEQSMLGVDFSPYKKHKIRHLLIQNRIPIFSISI